MREDAKPIRASAPIDLQVGQRLRARRIMRGMSQTALADAVGLRFQQIQKYESGSTRVPASRLHEFATILRVSIGYFFEKESAVPNPGKSRTPIPYQASVSDRDLVNKREALQFVGAFNRIPSANTRRKILALLKALSAE